MRKEDNCSLTDISKGLSQQEVWLQPASQDGYRRTSRNQHSASAGEIMTESELGNSSTAHLTAQRLDWLSTQYNQDQQGNLGQEMLKLGHHDVGKTLRF